MNGAPALRLHVDGDEEVARKQRRRHRLDPARMPAALEIARQIGRKALADEMAHRLGFRMGLSLHDIPARGHGVASWRGRGRTPRSFGASTRSGPTTAAAASKVACGAREVGDHDGVEGSFDRGEGGDDGNPDEGRRRRLGIDHRDDLDAALERADARDLGEIGHPRDDDALESAAAERGEDLRAFGAGLPKEREREAEILDRQPGFLGKAVGRQVIGVAPRRRLADLDEALLDAAFEVGVDEAKRDPEFSSQAPLRLPAVALDRLQQSQHDALAVLVLGGARHSPTPSVPPSYNVRHANVKPDVHWMNADN